MYICPMYSSELIKGTLKTIVLNLLKEQGKMYGYEITQHVKLLSNEKIQITEGALYPLLHALEKQGEVTTESEYIGKRIRKYYSLTEKGAVSAKDKVSEFADFMATMRFLLNLDSSISNG